MYKPKTYVRVMEFANALRTLGDLRPLALVIRWKLMNRFDNLVEQAYEVGHDQGYSEGMRDGRQKGREEALCHRQSDEEWEHTIG